MKVKFILIVFSFFSYQVLLSQEAFLVRQTLSSNGSSSTISTSGESYLVQQSIGQSSVAGNKRNSKTMLNQGFIQAPFSGSVFISSVPLLLTSYPNPVHEQVFLDFSQEDVSEADIILRDVTGKLLYSSSASGLNDNPILQIQTSFLSSGIYFLQVNSGGRAFVKQLAKS